jgi:hypothetical protein
MQFHRRYLDLIAEIEQRFAVSSWKHADLELWPLARMDLYLDMYWSSLGVEAPQSRAFWLRPAARLARPLRNLWRSRRDLRHWVARPRPAHAIFLGDGVSIDRLHGEAADRYGEPVMKAIERRGLSVFAMQSGDLSRLPWYRATYAANVIATRGARRSGKLPGVDLPDHDAMRRFLAQSAVFAPSLARSALARRADSVLATAAEFEKVLQIVRPTLAFVVTYYSGMGPAYLLACRRRGILSVDLQHCPQGGTHKAYVWDALPERGYATLPGVFWNWTQDDAAAINRWTAKLQIPWHRGLYAGNSQLSCLAEQGDFRMVDWETSYAAIAGNAHFEREILVALQPVGGYRAAWDTLAAQIESAPKQWRWWIRRHPAASMAQDAEYAPLISLRKTNVVVDEALALPLPALLRKMSVIVSLYSGAAAEAALFGVPALFLSLDGRDIFPGLVERGSATVIDAESVNERIAGLPASARTPPRLNQPSLEGTLTRLEAIACEYAQLCATSAVLGRA